MNGYTSELNPPLSAWSRGGVEAFHPWEGTGSEVVWNATANELYQNGLMLPDNYAMGIPRPQTLADNEWVVGGILLMLMALLSVWSANSGYIRYKATKFITSSRHFSTTTQHTTTAEVVTILLPLLIGAACLTLLASTVNPMLIDHSLSTARQWTIHSITFALPLIWILLKTLVYTAVNTTFFGTAQNIGWLGHYYFLTAICAALLLPLTIVGIYTDIESVNIAHMLIALLIVYEILLFYKLFEHFQTKKYEKLMIFSYFCTAEVLPIIVCGHFLTKITVA